MANILVTGANGQLGSEIKELVKNSLDSSNFYFTTSQELDITEHEKVKTFILANNIEVIINCAAYTAVDKAETEQDLADKINHLAVKNLAQIAKEKNIKLIHISTDYVYDGKNYKPYKEDDTTSPQSVYGRTKRDGEKAMQELDPQDSIIIRTSWVYSAYGNNFVKTMLRLGKEKTELGVIFDQVGSPTYAKDLAQAILEIVIEQKSNSGSQVQIYHYSNEGVLSWYDFAKEIMRMAKLECKINPIETKEYPTPASRPHYSLLNKAKIKKEFGLEIPYYKDGLDDCLRRLGERK
ncbi:MAG: dTDP-4-dehydrorhamnose reductase [Helicobacteraceae bacterium]|nr:dTDP-4-dehydrorhamnose reductase [Helicobacteraceae bacterium]